MTRNIFTGKKESVGQADSEVASNSGWGVCSGTCDEEYQEVVFSPPQSIQYLTRVIITETLSHGEGKN